MRLRDTLQPFARTFFSPWFQLGCEAAFVTASEVFLKLGAAETAVHGSMGEWLGISALASLWVWAGIACLVLSFVCWIYVLKHLPLSVAFPLTNVVHVTIPISSWIFLGEAITARRWMGIVVVVAGLALVAKPVATLDEKL
ncbi:MAG: EamA family transporter [Verrucomicrobia bacterium]|nr:EamA family transporter [Verrucomicrobiota bacterium]